MICGFLHNRLTLWLRIKKAYRRKALELHPDRNFGNVEAVTELFAEVQSAYEVLSDPQERAWYDSHRDAILFGANKTEGGEFDHNTKVTTADDVLGYFGKFNSRIQFTDSPTGFFGGLRELFEQIAREEAFACRWDGLEPFDYPSFGSKDDDHTTVREFYSAWSGFATQKSYSWKDVYRYSEAPDRRVRRLMEKENKCLRDEAIREFNDSVRSLVAFAKKRDPRYIPTAQSEAERQKQLRESAAAQAARSRAANEAKIREFSLPEWAQTETVPEDDYTSETESEQESFVCEICRKHFKSEKQFEAHERSKKHIKAVKEIQRAMRNEDKLFQLNSEQSDELPAPLDQHSKPELPQERTPAEFEDNDNENGHPDESLDTSVGDDVSIFEDMESVEGTCDSGDDENNAVIPDMPESRTIKKDDRASGDEDDCSVDNITQQFSEATVADSAPPQRLGKAKQRRAKKAVQKATEDGSLSCSMCHASFPSRTKLFDHIKELGHVALVNKAEGRTKVNKKKSKK